MLNRSDEEAAAEATEARRRGTEMIEDHLSHHLNQNPDSSYVTWVATLHPENADVTIDPRFFVPNNPWWSVYEAAKADIPIATAVPVDEDAQNTATALAFTTPTTASIPVPVDQGKASEVQNKPDEASCSTCSPMGAFIGSLLSIVAVVAVFAVELAALIVYFLAAFFWNLCKVDRHNVCCGFFSGLFMFLYSVLSFVDSALLVANVLIVEVVARACFLLCLLFGGCGMAGTWHQYIRRTCHLARWAFRSPSVSPKRQFCCCKPKSAINVEEDEEEGKIIGPPIEDSKYSHSPSAPLEPETVVVIDEGHVVVDDRKEDTSHKGEDAFKEYYS